MRLSSGARKRRALNMTPLIDVVFLLLVFFMLASTFLRFSAINVETATGGGTAGGSKADIVLLHLAGQDDWRVNGTPVLRSELSHALAESVADGKKHAVLVVRDGAAVSDVMYGLTVARDSAFETVRVVE